MLADQQFVQSLLAPYEGDLHNAVHQGWRRWGATELAGKLKFPGRSRACLVFDFTVQALQAELSKYENVKVFIKDETAKIVLIILWFCVSRKPARTGLAPIF